MRKQVTVCCVYWGDKFPIEYVTNLKRMVARNTTIPHHFICFSDKKIKGVETRILKKGFDGWWNKLQLFDVSNNLPSENVVYLDLDTVITGNIDWLLKHRGIIMGIEDVGSVNKHQPHLKGRFQSAVMTWDYYLGHSIWSTFMADREKVMNTFRGDGEYLNYVIPELGRDLVQNKYPGRVLSYKYQVYPGPPDDKTSIILFHGRPSIIQAMNETIKTPMATYKPQTWIEDYWK